MYVIDAAGDPRVADLARLPSCGAVIRADETERLRRLLRRLADELDARAAGRLGRDGRVVVAIDGVAALRSTLLSLDGGDAMETLHRLVRDGRDHRCIGQSPHRSSRRCDPSGPPPHPHPRRRRLSTTVELDSLPVAVRAVLGDATLTVDVAPSDNPAGGSADAGIAVYRCTTERDIVILVDRAGQRLAAGLERLGWLDGTDDVPDVVASGSAAEGLTAAVVHVPAHAVGVASGRHPFGPEAVADTLAAQLRTRHRSDPGSMPGDPFDASLAAVRAAVVARLDAGEVPTAVEGPYAGRSPEELLAVVDTLHDRLGEVAAPTPVLGTVDLRRTYLDRDADAYVLDWADAGIGDPHQDLASAAVALRDHYGPAVVAPFLDAYGLDDVDLARLDLWQTVDHLRR